MKLVFEPEKWHVCSEEPWQICQDISNCYSYALNKPGYYWSVPGMGYVKMAGQKFINLATDIFQQYSLQDFQIVLKAGAEADGLISVDAPTVKEGYYLTALVFSDNPDNLDFHWHRQDDDGVWSSKNGWHKPSRKDAKGNLIQDPRDAQDSDYPIFGGFFLVPRAGAILHPSTLIKLPRGK